VTRRFLALLLVGLTACSHATVAASRCPRAGETPGPARWTRELDASPGAAAVDTAGAVVTLPEVGVLAVDAAGADVWRTALPGAGLDWPVIDGDLVVVPASSASGAECVALDRASGAIRWRHATGSGPAAAVGVAGDTVVCASADGRVDAVDRATGATRWSLDVARATGTPISISPRGAVAIDLDTARVGVVINGAGLSYLLCLDLVTVTEPGCSINLGSGGPPSAVAAGPSGTFVVGSGAEPGVYLVDLRANKVRAGVGTAEAFDPASVPVVAGGLAVVVDRGGGVTAVDARDGSLRWRANLGQPVLDAKPAVAAGVLSVVDWTGRIHTFRLADGHRAAAVDERGGAIAIVADPAGTHRVVLRRGLGGDRLEGAEPSGRRSRRPLQCRTEPGHSTRNDARP
jgi:outer membrane protein assembly factor BamB